MKNKVQTPQLAHFLFSRPVLLLVTLQLTISSLHKPKKTALIYVHRTHAQLRYMRVRTYVLSTTTYLAVVPTAIVYLHRKMNFFCIKLILVIKKK